MNEGSNAFIHMHIHMRDIYRSFEQNIVSFEGLFCKRDLYFPDVLIHMRDMSSLTSEGVLKVSNELMTESNNELKIEHNELKIENDELVTEKNEKKNHEKCLSSCFSCDG